MKTLHILGLLLFVTGNNFAQFKDSNETVVYNIDNPNFSNFKISTNEAIVEFLLFDWESSWVDTNDTLKITAIKKSGVFAKGGLTNTKKLLTSMILIFQNMDFF
ncbi:hypothetical protein [Flavobacterium sp. CAU 1735]|uniref:hypothetical protein n=1 Tax=Flavobacterium sp. CAU 1735 TaxID=3140361 RepID=UPI0032607F1E